MKVFTVWAPGPNAPVSQRDARAPVLVKDGIDWRVAFFGWLGLLRGGAWMSGLFAASATMLLRTGAGGFVAPWAILCLSHLVLAVFAGDLREWELRLRGFRPDGVIVGASRDGALLRYLDRVRTEGAGEQRRGAPGGLIPDPFAVASARL